MGVQQGSRGRHALVTGASSGIGAAIVRRLLAEGWRVSGVARRATTFDNPAYTGIEADLADAAACQHMLDRQGPVNALVHAAGTLFAANLGALDPAVLEQMWRLHVATAEQLANHLAPRMASDDRIVLIGSRTAAGSAGRSQYAATKAALVAMARSWAIELAPRGISVNVVAPAATDTPMLADPNRAGLVAKVPPVGRYIRPDEIAGGVAYLLSPDAGAVTGQVLTICGGSSL
jgi:3-oxoacyl-[acyl-carrier protein] reductase